MCKDCAARRELARKAFLGAKFGEAAKQVAKGAAEAVGLKKKTGSAEMARTVGTRARKTTRPVKTSRK